MAGKNKRGKRLRNDKARGRTCVNIGSDQLSSAGENSSGKACDRTPRLLCFFSIGASICPPKKNVISTLVLRALFTGTCVSLINACVAGILFVPPLDCVDLFQNSVFNTTIPNIETCCYDLFKSTVNNGTISFEGSWSGVKNATIYFANCCGLYQDPICL